jgi:hypothetical protein
MYDHLLAEIGMRKKQASSESKWIEECFHLSFATFSRLQEMVKNHDFTDLQEEIWFFKIMKPQFAGQMEYFVLVYMSAVFAPEDAGLKMEYWQQELRRSQAFFSKHEEFYQYYKLGRTEFDPKYFVRTAISYADLAANLIARERYLEYLQSKIQRSSN